VAGGAHGLDHSRFQREARMITGNSNSHFSSLHNPRQPKHPANAQNQQKDANHDVDRPRNHVAEQKIQQLAWARYHSPIQGRADHGQQPDQDD
jgi:hypothetical protein